MASFLNRFNSIHNLNQIFNYSWDGGQNGFYEGLQWVMVGIRGFDDEGGQPAWDWRVLSSTNLPLAAGLVVWTRL
jgi:hypothetical protein